eukprot:1084817-Pelagomonas_calceolata.AAC.1
MSHVIGSRLDVKKLDALLHIKSVNACALACTRSPSSLKPGAGRSACQEGGIGAENSGVLWGGEGAHRHKQELAGCHGMLGCDSKAAQLMCCSKLAYAMHVYPRLMECVASLIGLSMHPCQVQPHCCVQAYAFGFVMSTRAWSFDLTAVYAHACPRCWEDATD